MRLELYFMLKTLVAPYNIIELRKEIHVGLHAKCPLLFSDFNQDGNESHWNQHSWGAVQKFSSCYTPKDRWKKLTNLRKPHFCNTHLRTRKKFTCVISEHRLHHRIQPVNVVSKEKSLVFQTKETRSCTLLDKCSVVNAVTGSSYMYIIYFGNRVDVWNLWGKQDWGDLKRAVGK